MRMIDVGGIKDSLLPELLSGVDGGTGDSYLKTYEVIDRIEKIVNEWVDNQITVEAIPIEFIKEQIAKTTDINDEDELDFFYAGHLGYLLNLWEEQNEKDI